MKLKVKISEILNISSKFFKKMKEELNLDIAKKYFTKLYEVLRLDIAKKYFKKLGEVLRLDVVKKYLIEIIEELRFDLVVTVYRAIAKELRIAFSAGHGSFTKIKTELIRAYAIGIVILLVIACIGLYSRFIIIDGFNETATTSLDIAEMQNLIVKVEHVLTPVNNYLISSKRDMETARFNTELNKLRSSLNKFAGVTGEYEKLIHQLVPYVGLLEQVGYEILELEHYEYRKGARLMREFDANGHDMQDLLNLKASQKKVRLSYLVSRNESIMNTLNMMMLLGGLVVSILGIILILYLEKNVRNPLEEIIASVQTLDIDKWEKVKVESFSELSVLADGYNNMIDRLKDSYDNLEELVSERTAELEESNSNLEKANSKLEILSTKDGLTGLNNHRHFMESFTSEFQRASRFNHKLTLLIMDIDFFKKYNDTFGHQIGDEVLKSVAKIFEANVRDIDFLGRYGGEEFCIFLREVDVEGGKILAEKQRRNIEEFKFCQNIAIISKSEDASKVTISVGVATFPDHASSVEELFKVADNALYVAKDNGRNRVEVATPMVKTTKPKKKSKKNQNSSKPA